MDAQTKLVLVTQELLWERGYVGTSPKAIQQRSGVGQGSMYHHFRGKEELCAAAVQRSAADLRAEVEPILSGPGTAVERITVYLRRERKVLRGCRIGGLTQDPEITSRPELRGPIEETLLWLQGRLAEVVAEGQASGELPDTISARQTASMISAVLQGGYVLARGENSELAFAEAIDGALAMLTAVAARAGSASERKAS
jgi:AcrR family transcriptional regulator